MSMTGMSESTEIRQEKNSEITRIPLAKQVRSALEHYFQDLDGQDPTELYRMVLNEIEKPLLEIRPVALGRMQKATQNGESKRYILKRKVLRQQ